MRIESREVLKRAISGKGSPLFLSKNANDIRGYLKLLKTIIQLLWASQVLTNFVLFGIDYIKLEYE